MAFGYTGNFMEFPNTRLSDLDNIRLLQLYKKLTEEYTFIVNTTRDLNNKLYEYINQNNRYVDDKINKMYLNVNTLILEMEKRVRTQYLQLEKTMQLRYSELLDKDENILLEINKLRQLFDTNFDMFNAMQEDTISMCKQLIKLSESKMVKKINDEHNFTVDEIKKIQEQLDAVPTEILDALVRNPFEHNELFTPNEVFQYFYNYGINGGGFTAEEFDKAEYITAEFFDKSNITALRFYTNGREKLGYFTNMFFGITGANPDIQEVLKILAEKIGE